MADRLKIFHINMHRKWGGQPNRVLVTALGLRELGHEVVVSGPRGSMLVERARAAGFEVFEDIELRSGFRPRSFFADVRALKAHLRAKKYDVVDTHGSQDTWRMHFALLGWPAGERPAFVRSRHNIFPVSGNPMNRWLYWGIDHVITVSPQVIPHLGKVMPAERCTAIFSAPDPGRFAPKSHEEAEQMRREARAELGIGGDERLIGVVGRLAPEKGHRYLVEAAPKIVAAVPGARFVFVGTGRTREALEQQIAALGNDMARRFTLTGFREDVPRLLRAFDLFVLPPTEGESLGTSILEAFLAERPVVATDVGGVGESVVDGVTGRLVPAADPEAVGEAVIYMLQNGERARELALAGKARVEARFTPEAIARQTEAVYRRVLAER